MSSTGRRDDPRERRLHERYRLLAAAAVDGRIDPEDAADLESHLLACDPCSAEYAAMQADHRLLAQPAQVLEPASRVRVAVLDAARAPRVPRVREPRRPFAQLLPAALVVMVVVGAAILLPSIRPSVPGAGSSDAPTPPGTTAPTATRSIPVGIATGHFAGSPGDGALDVDIRIVERIEDGGSATVVVEGPFGESWTGRVTSTQFWADPGDPRGLVWVAYLEGCKAGTSCDAFQLMLVDARDTDGRDWIALDFYPSLAEIDPEGPVTNYHRTAGSLDVTGPIPVVP
jgi:hypothetical protein